VIRSGGAAELLVTSHEHAAAPAAEGWVGSFAMSEDPLFRFEHVSCSYGGPPAIEAVDLTMHPGEFVGIVGPSGSGKTTVLRALVGGVVPVFGHLTVRSRLRMAYVPQVETVDWNFPVTVAEVILMTKPQRRWWPRATADERREIDDVLERLGLAGLGSRHIRELSGGQQQRVFLARAMVQRPELLVLDEPTSGVDVRTRHEVLHVLTELHDDGLAIVLTTHDLNGLAAHLPRLVCFNRTVIADGAPRSVLQPYVLERTYGAPMSVLEHGGMPVVLDQPSFRSSRLRETRPA
jgi:ABC-type Mn2+/Zn2+ transport system ATPase subunit